MVEYIQFVQKQATFIPQTPHLPRVLTTALNKVRLFRNLNYISISLLKFWD